MRETFERGGGLVRFGIDATRLHTGEALRRKAHMNNAIWNGLAAEGKRQGADPSDGCSSVEDVPLDGLAIETMNASFKWEPFAPTF